MANARLFSCSLVPIAVVKALSTTSNSKITRWSLSASHGNDSSVCTCMSLHILSKAESFATAVELHLSIIFSAKACLKRHADVCSETDQSIKVHETEA